MATYTRAQIIGLALEAIGIKPLGVAARAEDTQVMGDAFDSLYQRLRKRGLVPFATSAVEDWAWGPLVDVLVSDVATRFGLTGQRLMEIKGAGRDGMRELSVQVASKPQAAPTKPYWF